MLGGNAEASAPTGVGEGFQFLVVMRGEGRAGMESRNWKIETGN